MDRTTRSNLYPAIDFSLSRASNEEKLAALCSRMNAAECQKKEISSIVNSGDIDWQRFLGIADIHGVHAFAYRNLQSDLQNVPERVKNSLRERSAEVFARNLKFRQIIKSLAVIFQKGGVDALFTKGVPFMLDVYEEMGFRDFSDIDMLIKEEDLERAGRILRQNGFFTEKPPGVFSRYRTQSLFFFGDGTVVDLHTGFIGRKLHDEMLKIDKNEIWENKIKLSMDGAEIYTMDPVYTLIYHCLHISVQHSFMGMKWYVDLHEMISRYGEKIDWEKLAELTRKYRIKRPVYYALFFTKNMFETSVPDYILQNLEKTRSKIDPWIFKKIKSGNTGGDYFAELAMFDSTADIARFIFSSIVTYPYKIFDFFRIFLRMMKKIVSAS